MQAGLAALAESDERISCQDIRKTLGLALTPRPVGSITLQGADLWRVVIGDYRVIYAIDDDNRVITVARVRHRGEVYRDE